MSFLISEQLVRSSLQAVFLHSPPHQGEFQGLAQSYTAEHDSDILLPGYPCNSCGRNKVEMTSAFAGQACLPQYSPCIFCSLSLVHVLPSMLLMLPASTPFFPPLGEETVGVE